MLQTEAFFFFLFSCNSLVSVRCGHDNPWSLFSHWVVLCKQWNCEHIPLKTSSSQSNREIHTNMTHPTEHFTECLSSPTCLMGLGLHLNSYCHCSEWYLEALKSRMTYHLVVWVSESFCGFGNLENQIKSRLTKCCLSPLLTSFEINVSFCLNLKLEQIS